MWKIDVNNYKPITPIEFDDLSPLNVSFLRKKKTHVSFFFVIDKLVKDYIVKIDNFVPDE